MADNTELHLFRCTPSHTFLPSTHHCLATYSPGVGVSGISVTPSPGGIAPSNGNSEGQWIEQQPRHVSSSLTAILSSGCVGGRHPQSGLPDSPSPRAQWQQHRLRQGLPGVHSSTPPQPRKRAHIEEPKRYSDTSSDDDARLGDLPRHGP